MPLKRTNGEPLGIIQLSAKVNGEFTQADQEAIEWFALLISATLEIEYSKNQLEKTEALSRAVLSSAVDPIITMDVNEIIQDVNPATEKLFGYDKKELIGKTIHILMPLRYKKEHSGYIKSYITTGVKKIIGIGREVEAEHKNGSIFPIHLSVSEFVVGDSRFFTGIIHDLSTERALMIKLKRSNQALNEFAYIASHDLKEPLRGINNYSQFLLEDYEDKLDDEGKIKLNTLKKLTFRMEALLDNLMNYSKLDRIDSAIKKCDLNVQLRMKLELLDVFLQENKMTISLRNSLPIVECDGVRIGEVFQNLITNAVKYNKNEKKTLIIDVNEQALHYLLSFKDNGIGISKEYHEEVFKIFRRIHARDDYGGGTGAGLSIVRKIIEQHDGEVWVESVEGEGTTIFITLPKVFKT